MINLESDAQALASLYSDVAANRGDLEYVQFVKRCLEAGIYNEALEVYTDEQLEYAARLLQFERDNIFKVGGIVMLHDRYLMKLTEPNTWAREYPQEAFLTTALVLASTAQPSVRLDRVEAYYDAISLGKISLATPFLTNARRSGAHNSTASCFILKVEDDLDSISQSWSNAAHIASYGGGLGISLDAIRAGGASVRNMPRVAKGLSSWLNIFNSIACAVDQAGTRKAAYTVSVGIHHADVLDVIQSRKETEISIGDERKRAPELFPQVVIHDNFMRAAIKDDEWHLFDPAELLRYHDVDIVNTNGSEYEDNYDAAVAMGKAGKLDTFKTVRAMHLVKEVIKCWVETGFPYIFFKSAANREQIGSGQVYSANLCVSGDTRVLTRRGNLPIAGLEGELVEAWNGNEWSMVQFIRTNPSAKVFDVCLDNGETIRATGEHQWIMGDGDQPNRVSTLQLQTGDRLAHTEVPVDWDYLGDAPPPSRQLTSVAIALYNPSKLDGPIKAYLDMAIAGRIRRDDFYTFLTRTFDTRVRLTYPDLALADYPSVTHYGSDKVLSLLSRAMRVYGIGNKYLPLSGEIEIATGNLAKMYQLLGEYAVPGLSKMYEGDDKDDLILALAKHQDNVPSVRVVSVTEVEEKEPTFCATEQHRNQLVFNGQLTGNCVESFTPFDHYLIHVCNLVSLNLHNIERDSLGYYAGLAVQMLNAVVELTNDNLLPGAQAHNRMYRAIGIGVMGLSDLFVREGIHWREDRAAEVAGEIMEDIAYHALKMSIQMGSTHPARCFQDPNSTWQDGLIYGKPLEWYQRNSKDPLRWETLHEKLKTIKPMNCYLVSVAPNTSTARLWGVSASWLPRWQIEYQYIWNDTAIPIRPPIDDDRKWFYTIDKTLDQSHKIKVAAAMQKWIDQGISLELAVNLNPGVYDRIPTTKLWQWWRETWEAGLKSIYYISNVAVYTDHSDDDADAQTQGCESCAV